MRVCLCVCVCETVGLKPIMLELREARPIEKTNMPRILISSLGKIMSETVSLSADCSSVRELTV